jgi:drug/metabolite transporter (DMT)-like permease
LGSWAVLKGQGATGAILTIPLLAALIALGFIGGSATHTGPLVRRSVEAGAINALAFTLVPFALWYRGIARCGVARTSVCCFAEPLVATLFSLLVLRDAPATPALLAGVVLVLGAIAASLRFSD